MKVYGQVKGFKGRDIQPIYEASEGRMASRGRYSESFKCEVLALVDGGTKIAIAASIKHVSPVTVNNWIRERYERGSDSR